MSSCVTLSEETKSHGPGGSPPSLLREEASSVGRSQWRGRWGRCQRVSPGASLSFLTRLSHGSGCRIATELSRCSCASFPKCVWGTKGTESPSSGLSRVCLSPCAESHIPLWGIVGAQSLTPAHCFYACKFFPNKSRFRSTPRGC